MKLASIFVLLAVTPAVAESPKPVAKAPAETTAEKAGRAFLKTSIESVDAIALPKAGLQYFFTLPGSTKGCESLTTGTAKAAAEATKLKTCIAAAYKAIGQGGAVAKIGVAEVEMDKFVGHFPKADQKKMREVTAGTKIVESNLSGDGESLRISLSIHPTNGVVAVWLDAEAVE